MAGAYAVAILEQALLRVAGVKSFAVSQRDFLTHSREVRARELTRPQRTSTGGIGAVDRVPASRFLTEFVERYSEWFAKR